MPLAIYPWQEALSRDLEIFRHRMPSGIIVNVTHNASKIANNLFFIFIFSSC